MKICPKCQSAQQDARLVVCPTCKLPFQEPAEPQARPQPLNEKAIAEALSASQLEKISDHITKSWRFRLILVGLLVVSIFLSVPTVVMITMRRANSEIQSGIAAMQQQAKSELAAASNVTALQFQAFAQGASNQVQEAHKAVTSQIVAQLQIPKVRETVESVARAEAQSILRAEVQPAVANFRTEIAATLKQLSNEQGFLGIATRARASDYAAYLRLCQIATQTNTLAKDAARIVSEIDEILSANRSSSSYRQYVIVLGQPSNNPPVIYKGPFTSDEIALGFKQASSNPRTRESLAQMSPSLDGLVR